MVLVDSGEGITTLLLVKSCMWKLLAAAITHKFAVFRSSIRRWWTRGVTQEQYLSQIWLDSGAPWWSLIFNGCMYGVEINIAHVQWEDKRNGNQEPWVCSSICIQHNPTEANTSYSRWYKNNIGKTKLQPQQESKTLPSDKALQNFHQGLKDKGGESKFELSNFSSCEETSTLGTN